MSMLLFIPHELWSIIDDSGSVVSSVVSSHPTLLSFHMLAGNVDRARTGIRPAARRGGALRAHRPTALLGDSRHTTRFPHGAAGSPGHGEGHRATGRDDWAHVCL